MQVLRNLEDPADIQQRRLSTYLQTAPRGKLEAINTFMDIQEVGQNTSES